MALSTDMFRRSVIAMRILCPIAFVASVTLCGLNLAAQRPVAAAVAAFCGGINVMLSWVQFRIFKI